MEFDVVEGEKGTEAANVQALLEFQKKAVNMKQTITITEAIHIAGFLHAITSRIARIVTVGERKRDQRALLKARPNSSGPTSPIAVEVSHFMT